MQLDSYGIYKDVADTQTTPPTSSLVINTGATPPLTTCITGSITQSRCTRQTTSRACFQARRWWMRIIRVGCLMTQRMEWWPSSTLFLDGDVCRQGRNMAARVPWFAPLTDD